MAKQSLKQALAMAAIMGAAANEYFDTGRTFSRQPNLRRSSAQERIRSATPVVHHINYSEHEFVIKGETILARNRKTAIKIYANRHPEMQKRKK